MWTTSGQIPFLWMFIPAMSLYVLGDWLEERRGGYALQSAPLTAAYIFGVYMVLFPGEWKDGMMEQLRPEPLFYIGALVLLFAVSLAGKMKNGKAQSAFEWVLLVPFIYMPSGIELLYLLSLFFFSLYVLWCGYAQEWRFKINFGTLLFICSTLVAYGKLTWDFMDKSLFFIIGGMILLGLGWFLNRRKKNRFWTIRRRGFGMSNGSAVSVKRRSLLVFGLVLLQALVLAGVAVSYYAVGWFGQDVRVRTVPVDPRDLLYGDYVTLSYDISQLDPSLWKDPAAGRSGAKRFL